MKITKITLLTSLTVILPIFYLNLIHNQGSAVDLETVPMTEAEMQTALEATIQIYLFPSESLGALGVDQQQISLNEALSKSNIEYRYELGLGTLVSRNGEIILITHDHWGRLDTLGMVQFRNAAGDLLLELDGDTFKELIRYQDGGTLILGKPTSGDQSDYLAALVWTSQAKYNRIIRPAELGSGEGVGVGQALLVVRQGRNGRTAVELISASVESTEERWGQPVYKLRNANDKNIMPGDSGGGLWLGGRFVGNMWKSKSTYGWNWDTLELEKVWAETSFAAGLPDSVGEIIQNVGSVEIVSDAEIQANGEEY